MTPLRHPGVGSFRDRLVRVGHLDEPGTPWRSCVSNFIKIGHQEPRQDDLHPGVGSIMDRLVGVGHLDESETPWRSCDSNFVKIGHQEPRQDDPHPSSWSWFLYGQAG